MLANTIAAGIDQMRAALLIDYGYVQPKLGATLSGLKNHQNGGTRWISPEKRLTALVDFTSLEKMFQINGYHCVARSPDGFFAGSGLLEKKPDNWAQINR